MAFNLSPVGGAAGQFFDDNGDPLSGGKIYTYAAGSTTPQVTYTDPAGVTPNANPIILNAGGRPPSEIWLPVGVAYKFVIKDSDDVLIATYDSVPSGSQPPISNDASSISYEQGNVTAAGSFIPGQSYRIASLGTTDFTSIGALANVTGLLFTATSPGAGTGTAFTSQTVQQKLQQTVSVRDFGAVGDWNGTQSSPGTGTDDTAAIQAAINYCIANGASLFFPQGRYRTTAPLVIDKTSSTNDPINGDMSGIAIQGASARSAQIVADHDGVCLDYRGGNSAGIHSYLNINGVGLLKANYNRAAGSIGLKMNLCAYFSINRFDMYGFEYGIYGIDCVSGAFEDGTIRGNDHGFYFTRGVSTWPNSISFRAVMTLNNFITGGTLYRPSVFSYIGGSIESNGFTGILADPNCWGLYVESAGTEGSVGINMQGVYIENNNGIADIWILQTINSVVHNINGCSFLRFQNTRYVTSCVLFNSVNDTRLAINGCGFKDYAPYVSDNARPWIAAGDAKVFDGGGNFFFDASGDLVGLQPAVFAPIASNHQLPYASLPTASKFKNGIQYCADGTGAALPSLAVSDGTKWWQIPLGQFAGRVASAGTALRLPRGWSCTRTLTGVYVITHNLNLGANTYAVTATPSGAPGQGYCSGMALSGDTFEIYFANTSGVAANMDFNFAMTII